MSSENTPLEYWAKYGSIPEVENSYPAECYWLWLADLLKPANPHTGNLLEIYGSAENVWDDRGSESFRKNIGQAAWRRWLNQRTTPADFIPVQEKCCALHVRVITFADPEYPRALAKTQDPPLVLYCTGDCSYLNDCHTVGMVGARRPTTYGISAAKDLGRSLAQNGAVIVSGLADGLDSVSHRAAVRAGKPTIGVLGVPIDKTYPAENAELRRQMEHCGVVISEYAPGEHTDHHISFLQRNRIIAGLSQVLIVLEAKERSGTVSTVGHAERYGRPVYAVPGSIYSPLSAGTNALLKTGRARMVTRAQDVLEQLGLSDQIPPSPAPEPPPKPQISPEIRCVLDAIGPKPIGLEALAEKTGLPTGKLLVALTRLELGGWIVSQPGQRYLLK